MQSQLLLVVLEAVVPILMQVRPVQLMKDSLEELRLIGSALRQLPAHQLEAEFADQVLQQLPGEDQSASVAAGNTRLTNWVAAVAAILVLAATAVAVVLGGGGLPF